MTNTIVVREAALADLADIAHWIADRSDVATALAYTDRIEAHFGTLADFPHRGSRRHSLDRGVRSLTFERRQIILYTVEATTVSIRRIVDAARDLTGFAL